MTTAVMDWPRLHRRRLVGRATGFVLGIAVVTALFAGAAALAEHHDPPGDAAVLSSRFTDTPTIVKVSDAAAIFVLAHGRPRAFLITDGRADPLTLCSGLRTPGIFVTRLASSTFTLDGQKLGGPTPRDLDQYRLTQRGDHIVVHTLDVIRGAGYGTDVHRVAWNERLNLEPTYYPPPRSLVV